MGWDIIREKHIPRNNTLVGIKVSKLGPWTRLSRLKNPLLGGVNVVTHESFFVLIILKIFVID